MKAALVGSVFPGGPGRRLAFAHMPHERQVREYTYVYAAVAPAEGKMTSLMRPTANTAMMQLFLEQVSQTHRPSISSSGLVDRAGWHGAKALAVPDNMRLIPQPASSPERNPVEHIWEDIREKQVPNLALPALEDVIDNVCTGLHQLEAAPERLRSMTYFPHFRFVC
jgi:hypothetical protein